MELIFLLIGLVVGALAAWLITRFHMAANRQYFTEETLNTRYILREVYDNLQNQADLHRDDLLDKEKELRDLGALLAARDQEKESLLEKLSHQKAELANMQAHFKTEFENIANRLLEEKSEKFTRSNQQQMNDLLTPLHEKIKTFESGIHQRFREESIDRISLKKEVEHLRHLNQQLSEDANNLVSALRGDSKTQGDWGEIQLERLLEKSGLQKDIHFSTQDSFKDHEGKDKRPDFIIHLPEEKHLIIDSKVSLVAYEKYFNAKEESDKKKWLKAHQESIKKHINDLSSKNYQQLYQINSPDYLLLFVPIEPAFTLAVQENQQLFLNALDKNIVLVTTSTLLATMRTVSFIWKQEKQKRSVLEIARQSGLLYDRFCNFVDDLKAIGIRLDHAQSSYHDAMTKLTTGKRYGDTLIGRAEKIKSLGAKTSKSLPQELLDQAEAKTEKEEEEQRLNGLK